MASVAAMETENKADAEVGQLRTGAVHGSTQDPSLAVPHNETRPSTATPIDAKGRGHKFDDHSNLWPLSSCFSDPNDRRAFLVLVASVLYFLGQGVIVVALKLLINERIGGKAEKPTTESALVDLTNTFLYAASSFICGRYLTGLSDHLGRKPLLVLAGVVMIATRIIYINAHTRGQFYAAGVLGGCFDCFFYTAMAWMCDLFHDVGTFLLYPLNMQFIITTYFLEYQIKKRNKRVGIFIGLCGGLSLTISAPSGSFIAVYEGLLVPFYVSVGLFAASIIAIILLPVDDTLGIQKSAGDMWYIFGSPSTSDGTSVHSDVSITKHQEEVQHRSAGGSKRGLPASWSKYLKRHFPISPGSIELMRQASRTPMDWVVVFLMFCIPALLGMVLVQFCLALFGWPPTISSLAVFSVGFCMGLFGPILLNLYQPVPLAARAMCLFTSGIVLLSVAGSGVDAAPIIGKSGLSCVIFSVDVDNDVCFSGGFGIACVALGTSWIPALQSNITTQYPANMHGKLIPVIKDIQSF
jgi:MFS family permease